MQQIINISANFQLEGVCTQAELHRSGHIHTTYLLSTVSPHGGRQYILQKVNQNVFPRPDHLASNMQKVTDHIRHKALEIGRVPSRAALTMIPTLEGMCLHQDEDGAIWRVFDFIEGTTTYEIPQNEQQVYQAGRAMGDFLCLLADFPPDELVETIPNFHHTPSRLRKFHQTLARDAFGRASGAGQEIDFVLSREEELSRLVDLLEEGRLPLRVTHNDTKISNVLFDRETGEAVCLIDLDTVMPGTLLYDFGDAVRTMAITVAEDEQDLDLVNFNLNYYRHLVRGFVHRADEILTPEELELLPFSAILMTMECGMRFLGDFLDGDRYFHTVREGHNLDRARTQFKLIEKMEQNYHLMRQAVGETMSKN
jgi:Ser/Thr protein kinase RdoA (MazF antagonist)